MEFVLRAIVVYFIVMVLFRLVGKRSLAEITPFDFVLLLVIGESTESALVGSDHSLTTLFIVVLTLMTMARLMDLLKLGSEKASKVLEDVPLIIVENGKPIKERLKEEFLREEDVMEAARELHGLERMEQIKYAVLETGGSISIIPVDGLRRPNIP
jgi:uncharacterized membrane protein YcaP (DUF421 family)